MKRKSRVKKDAFDWVDGSTEKQAATAQKNPPTLSKRVSSSKDPKTQAASVEITAQTATNDKQRSIFVAFIENGGEIIATQELFDVDITDISWPGLPDNMNSAAFELTGELESKKIIDIHKGYNVIESESSELELIKR